MADSVNIGGLSRPLIRTLELVIEAFKQGSNESDAAYDVLKHLHLDIKAVYGLTLKIHHLFSHTGFVNTIQDLQHEEGIGLLTSLARSLRGCSKEAQELLDFLVNPGLQARDGRFLPTKLYIRLSRQTDGINRFQRNFQDHKSTMQLALQLITTCQQMQRADDDAQQIIELKVQIDELQKAIERISHHITARQDNPDGDQDQDTQIVDDMKGIQSASVRLKKRATMQFEHLTSLSDDRKEIHSGVFLEETAMDAEQNTAGQLIVTGVPGDRVTNTLHSKANFTLPSNSSSIRSSEAARITTSTDFSAFLHGRRSGPTRQATGTENLDALQISHPDINHEQSSSMGEANMLAPAVSPNDFEEQLASLLSIASGQGMGDSKPYSEDLIIRIADLLVAVGKTRWSERPRTYLVLRLLREVQLMDDFVLHDFKDIDFPCTEKTLPPCIKENGVQHDFLHVQKYILSDSRERSTPLVSGGKHHHLSNGADAVFESLGKLGSGGFGIVDKVRLRSRLTLHEYAKRKRISRSGTFAKNRKALKIFENEVHNMKRLEHEHLVKFVGSYTDKHYIGIIMQPVADKDLYRYLSNEAWTDNELTRLRSWVGCLCSAVAYLHDNKCRHKDIKPHNVLIKGDNIMLADFGTAVDWTELESDVTVGLPDAHTNLYIAPEIGRQQPRDTSSDVWSLGCTFLEMATVLAGLSLRQKSDFFASLDTVSAAYWLNHAGIRRWITRLRGDDSSPDASIFVLIEDMMASEPDRRPTANKLVKLLSLAPYRNAGYTRLCCFDDIHSDSTSWSGSDVEEDDIFETAYGASDRLTMSSAGPPIPQRRTSSPSTSAYEESQSECSHAQVSPCEQLDHFQIGMSEKRFEDSCSSFAYDHSMSAPRTMSLDLTSQNSKRASSIQRTDLPRSESVRASPSFQSSAGKSTGLTEPGFAVEIGMIEQAFYTSHERLESLLIESRIGEETWLPQLLPFMQQELSDCKGFNILTMACKFGNTILGNEIVAEAIDANPRLIQRPTIFQLTALHYASHKGRMSTITQLLERGANAGVQDCRGRTALHIALHAGRQDIAKRLITSMALSELEAVDDMGESAIHILCRQQDSESFMEALLDAGCRHTTGNLRGHTPLQICQEYNNTAMSGLLLRDSSAHSRDQNFNPVPRGEAYWRHYADRDTTTCHCQWCSVCSAIAKTSEMLTTPFAPCSCLNHLTAFIKDTLSQRSNVEACRRHCLCQACVRGREYNKTHPPCGTPLSSAYLPSHEGIRSDAHSISGLLKLSLGPANPLHSGQLLPSYPGHKHYDDLINRKLSIKTSNLSGEEITAMVLSTLADAGFKGSKSYRKFPNEAAKRIIDRYDADTHVTKMVEILLDCGADINVTSRSKGLLTVAAGKGDLALIKLLLAKEVIIDSKDAVPSSETRWGVSKFRNIVTPRAESRSTNAARAALLHGQILACRMLLKAGADINRPESKDSHSTLLHAAVARCSKLSDFIPFLLAHGALPDMTDDNGDTALHLAVKAKHFGICQILLDSGADPNKLNKTGETPLGIAIRYDSVTHSKSSSGQIDSIVTLLLTYGADPHRTCNSCPCALFCALLNDKRAIAQLLLDEYSATEDVQRMDKDGSGLLHYLAYLVDDHAGPLLDRLLGYAPDLNVQNIDLDTPLHAAAFCSNLTVAMKLVDRKAIKRVQNRKGDTPLDLARNLRFRVVELEECLRDGATKKRRK